MRSSLCPPESAGILSFNASVSTETKFRTPDLQRFGAFFTLFANSRPSWLRRDQSAGRCQRLTGVEVEMYRVGLGFHLGDGFGIG
jgi:hypothetical protein